MKKNFTSVLILFSFLFLKTNIVAAQINTQDSLALVDFYNSTNGRHWFNHLNWLTASPVSTWFGVIVVNNRVSEITLVGDNLTGSLPAALGNLTKMVRLTLIGNYASLTGSIPPELGNLKNLYYLDLQANYLSGSIPPELGNLDNINYLNLRNNKLSGNIPPELGNLKKLTDLELQTNRLSGNIPSALSKLESLTVLGLFENRLSGNIPSELGKLISLEALGLANNKLSGSIPATLNNLTKLFLLELNNNQFTFAGMGQIAKTFSFAVYSPQASIPLYKNDNTLSVSVGSIPSHNTYKWYKGSTLVATINGDSTFQPTQNGNYSVTVTNSVATALTLYSDTIYVKTTINKNDSLALVDLYNSTGGPHWVDNTNWLTAAPVSTWYGITADGNRVTKIFLDRNNLVGKLPASLGNLTKLTDLSISYCGLKGNIPSSFGNLINLENLNFSYTYLSGSIPASLGNLTGLTSLTLRSGKLTGSIPVTISNLVNLINLNFEDNRLSGIIPAELGNLTKLQYLDLAGNKLSGNIPASFGNFTNLVDLFLLVNNLSGSIPAELGNLKRLQYLDLAVNNLSGTIPYSLTRLAHLSGLDLERNSFTFAGMGSIARAFPFAFYSPQANIALHKNGNVLSVSVGSVLQNNTYKWYKGSKLIATINGDSTFTPTQNGNYSVAVTNSVATQLTLYSDTVYYNAPGNLITSKLNNHSSISIYPNPAKSFTTLLFNADGKYVITVADITGRILQTKTGIAIKGSNIIQLDVSKYVSGIYSVTITDKNNRKQTIRLNKE